MPPLLSVAAYDEAEARAQSTTANRIIECCQPVTFMHEAYPTRIRDDAAALRYMDVMQEGRTGDTLTYLLGGITPEEMAALQSVAATVAAFTERIYGRRCVPRSGLLRALNVARQLRYVLPPGSVVLEVGAGSGWVGALLLEHGFRYIATDITQAFYIWQSHLFSALTGEAMLELATTEGDLLSQAYPHRVVHAPWWKFVVSAPGDGMRVDAVTCNHALCEMHPNALGYALRLAHRMLQGDRQHACLLFEGWGSTVRRPIRDAGRALAQAGFALAMNDVQSSVAVPRESASAAHAMHLPLPDRTDDSRWHPNIHVDERNALCRSIITGRRATAAAATLGLAEFDRMLAALVGHDKLATPDEAFLAFASA